MDNTKCCLSPVTDSMILKVSNDNSQAGSTLLILQGVSQNHNMTME